MGYRIVLKYTVHLPAYCRKSTYLTKCGEVVARRIVTFDAREGTCPSCAPEAWPSKDEQRAFDQMKVM